MFSICVCAAHAVSTLAAVFTPGLNGPHRLAVVDFSSPFTLVRTLCCNFHAKDKSAEGQSDGGADISKPLFLQLRNADGRNYSHASFSRSEQQRNESEQALDLTDGVIKAAATGSTARPSCRAVTVKPAEA